MDGNSSDEVRSGLLEEVDHGRMQGDGYDRPTAKNAFSKGVARRIFGLSLLLFVVFLWTASSVAIQHIFKSDFAMPFFLTYYSTSLFSLYLLDPYVWLQCKKAIVDTSALAEDDTMEDARANLESLEVSPKLSDDGGAVGPSSLPKRPLTTQEIIPLSCIFAPAWFIANYLFNYSLEKTSVASNSTISSLSGAFTLILSRIVFKEAMSLPKVIGTVTCVGGVALIAWTDSRAGKDTILGDATALGSAFSYGVYSVLLRWLIPDENRVRMTTFFGFVGLANFVIGLPFVVVLHFAKLESFHQVPPFNVVAALTLNGLIGTVLSDFLWAKSLLFTTPLIATIGLSLMIPSSILADILFSSHKITVWYIVGTLLVTGGFITVGTT